MTPVPTILAIIPARYESHRFPGKPLADLVGLPMIVRVARQAAKASRIDRVVVATDDERIARVVEQAGFEAMMTPSDCASGTDRVAVAQRALGPARLVVNVQGDEPLIDPNDIDALVTKSLTKDGIGTLSRPIEDQKTFQDPNAVKVVVAEDGRALYFSRAPIPSGAVAEGSSERCPLLHVGLYSYPPDLLQRLTTLPPSRLEQLERLEQLRAMENNIPIYVAPCVSRDRVVGVDTPEDLEAVAKEIERRNSADHASDLGNVHAT